MALVYCERTKHKVEMSTCSECFYKRHDKDVSAVWCKYNIYKKNEAMREGLLKTADFRLHELEQRADLLYKTGRPAEAGSVYIEIEHVRDERMERVMINEAIAHLTDQAMEAKNPGITKIEEYLTSICTTEAIASKLMVAGKTLEEVYKEIEAVARKQAKNGCAVISDEDVYQMVREYYELDTATSKPAEAVQPAEAVNILDFL